MQNAAGLSEGAADYPVVPLSTITGDEYVLLLVLRPGEESASCGGYIAESCARGRPPLVAVLTDGCSGPSNLHSPDALAEIRERETRLAMSLLGLPADRLLFLGLYDNTVPSEGWFFNTVVSALRLIMWRHDCNLICAPWRPDVQGDYRAARHIAVAVAERTGVGLMWYPTPASRGLKGADCALAQPGYRLDVSSHLTAKGRALAVHDRQHAGISADDSSGQYALGGSAPGYVESHETFLWAG